MTDHRKLVDEARALLAKLHAPGPWNLLASLADALEAQTAELARLRAVEAAAREVARVAVPYMPTDERALETLDDALDGTAPAVAPEGERSEREVYLGMAAELARLRAVEAAARPLAHMVGFSLETEAALVAIRAALDGTAPAVAPCGSLYAIGRACEKPSGHAGSHREALGCLWEDEDPAPAVAPEAEREAWIECVMGLAEQYARARADAEHPNRAAFLSDAMTQREHLLAAVTAAIEGRDPRKGR